MLITAKDTSTAEKKNIGHASIITMFEIMPFGGLEIILICMHSVTDAIWCIWIQEEQAAQTCPFIFGIM